MDTDQSWSRRIRVAAITVCLAAVPLYGFAEDEQQPRDNQTTTVDSAHQTAPIPVVRADIEVFGKIPKTPAVTTLEANELRNGQSRDAGDLLRVAPAVSSGRMGGHGLDPRIRGLGESSIRVLIDGAEVHGGCPNRMDPPSSFAAVESYDEVVVVRGVQTLRYGTAPGTVLFERLPVRFFDNSWWRASANAVAGTYNNGPALGFSAAIGTHTFSLDASGDRLKMNNYSDGDGEEIASAFDSRNGAIALGWTPDDLTSVRLSYELNQTVDALYAGAGMDSPESDTDAVRLRFRRDAGRGTIGQIRGDLYWTDVAHVMDNFSLREWTAPMAMSAPSTSQSTGGRLWIDVHPTERMGLSAGIDLAHNDREAFRFAGPNPDNVSMLQSVLWPEVDLEQNGVFIEGNVGVGAAGGFRFGIRGDRFNASAGAADVKPSGMNLTPRQLWESYYGEVDDAWEQGIVGGFARFEHRLPAPRVGFFAGFSRTARAADTTQRFMAGNSSMAPKRWVGNPHLEVEIHNQLDLGFEVSGSTSDLEVAVFIDDVDNAILRDRAHGQPGILKNDNATIYRNITARRTGAEVVGEWRIGQSIHIRGDAAYVWAQNTTDDRPIAQTPPLEGSLFASWASGRFGASGVVRWAATQNRVDDNPMTGSGLDVGATPGWAIFNLFGQADLGLGFQVLAGVDNALDRAYAYHLNRDNFFDPAPVQINEPGRTFWLRLRWSGNG
jgi:iron complex outermembrane receptor protein